MCWILTKKHLAFHSRFCWNLKFLDKMVIFVRKGNYLIQENLILLKTHDIKWWFCNKLHSKFPHLTNWNIQIKQKHIVFMPAHWTASNKWLISHKVLKTKMPLLFLLRGVMPSYKPHTIHTFQTQIIIACCFAAQLKTEMRAFQNLWISFWK